MKFDFLSLDTRGIECYNFKKAKEVYYGKITGTQRSQLGVS